MACKLDVDIVINKVIEKNVKNISPIKNNYASVTINFGKKDIEAIANLNKQWGENVITYNSPTDNDLPGNITISISENLYNRYIKAIDKKRVEEYTKQARKDLAEDAKRAGIEYTDDYLFTEIENYLNTPTSSETPQQKPTLEREQSINTLINKLYQIINNLGIKVKEVDKIYNEQQKINSLQNKLQDLFLPEEERNQILKEIEELKSKGVDKQALAVADILNRTINIIDKNDITKLTEEVVHFIVDIIEQKDPDLYKELSNKAWNYPNRAKIEQDYRNRQGEESIDKYVTKEVLGKVLTDYLVQGESIDEKKDEKTEGIWQSIVNFLKNLISNGSNLNLQVFQSLTNKILNSDFITPEDIQYLNKRGLYYSLAKQTSAEELVQELLKVKSGVEIKDVDGKPRYFYNGKLIERRVSDIVSGYYAKLFRNNDRKEGVLAEMVREEGIDIHNIFQTTIKKYVNENGEIRATPISVSYGELKDKYSVIIPEIDKVVQDLLKEFNNHYILTEIPIISNRNSLNPFVKKIGGTIDVLFVNKKTGEVSFYDWKTKRGKFFDKNTKKWEMRTVIPWWNMNGWRIELREYSKILQNDYGVKSFGQMRMIPIMTFEKRVENETVVQNAEGKSVVRTAISYEIEKIEIAPFEKSAIDAKKKQLLPLVSELEKSPLPTIQTITSKIRTLIDRNIAKMSKDYKNWEHLKEENQTLEALHTLLMVTTNIEEAVKSIKILLYDSRLFLDNEPNLNDLSSEEVFNLYKEVKNYNTSLSVYTGIEELTKDLYNESASDIVEKYNKELEKPSSEEREKYLIDNKTKHDAAKDLIFLSSRINSLRADLKAKEIEYMTSYGNKMGVPDLFSIEADDSWGESLVNNVRGLYSFKFKTAKLASKLILKANNILQDKNKESFNKMNDIRSKFIEGKNTNDLEELFSKILTYNAIKNDYFLIPKVDSQFYKEFEQYKEFFEQGYAQKGEKFLKTAEYKKIKEWLNENLDTVKYEESLNKRREAAIKVIKEKYRSLKLEDPEGYEESVANDIKKFEYFTDVYTSPEAWVKFNKSVYVNEVKWLSKEYKSLTPIEKETYEYFRSIYRRAESLGYVNNFFNINRVPFKLRKSAQFKEEMNPLKVLIFKKDDEIIHNFERIDPITGEQLHEVPIYMTDYLSAKETNIKKLTSGELKRYELLSAKDKLTDKEEKELEQLAAKTRGKRIKDIDLFQVYLEFEFNINRFEELSKVEDMLLTTIEIEENKKEVLSKDAFGKVSSQKIKKNDSDSIFIKRRETLLKKLILSNLYNINSEKDSLKKIGKDKYFSPKKAFKFLNDYTSLLYISGSLKTSVGALIGSSTIAATSNSKVMDGGQYLKGMLKNLAGKTSLADSSYIEVFNHRVTQKEVEELSSKRTELYKRLATNGKKYLIDHLQLVDTFIQDAVLYSTLSKHIIINNKIVNTYDYINSLIDPNLDYSAQKAKEKELLSKLKYKNLEEYLRENTVNGKADISKLDKQSVYDFENSVRLESKKIIGNMSSEDSYSLRKGIGGALFMKFKIWFPELVNTFFGEFKYREEGKRFEAGRFRSLGAITIAKPERKEDELFITSLARWISDQSKLALTAILEVYGYKKSSTISKNLEMRYLDYVQSLKEHKITDIPTKKEYIDIRIQEARNGLNFIASVLAITLLGNILAMMSGDDDKKDSPILYYLLGDISVDNQSIKTILRFLSMFTQKGLQESYTFTTLDGLLSTLTKISFPQLHALFDATRGAVSIGTTTVHVLTDGEAFDNNIKYTIEAIPIIRPFVKGAILLTKDTELGEELQGILNVNKNFKKKAKSK